MDSQNIFLSDDDESQDAQMSNKEEILQNATISLVDPNYFTQQDSSRHTDETITILMASDFHLGYKESHAERGEDSFDAFREIIKLAKDSQADFLLLGGDLFHLADPSQETLYKTIEILSHNIYGDGKMDLNFYTESKDNLQPNFTDDNLNIALPIFTIHGNHDYPCSNDISSIDLLHTGKYMNYFGKNSNYDEIIVKPIIFVKEKTKIAIYGLGYIKEGRLNYLLRNKKIKFQPPSKNLQDENEFINILVVHQNKFKGIGQGVSQNKCLNISDLPQDLVQFQIILWGHEHESVGLENNQQHNVYIYQPGSPIITSLIEAEAKPKHVGLFKFYKEKFSIEQIPLIESQRNVLIKNISLQNSQLDLYDGTEQDNIEKYLENQILELLEQAKQNQNRLQNHKKPLIRIKIEYSGFDMIRIQRLENKFQDKVANKGEILSF